MLDPLPDLYGPESTYSELVADLVPRSGPSDTVQGEVLRAALRVTAEFFSNGCGNWRADPAFFDEFVALLITHLCDGTFSTETEALARSVLNRLQTFGNCDYDIRSRDEELALDRQVGLIDRLAFAWCLRHPELLPRRQAS